MGKELSHIFCAAEAAAGLTHSVHGLAGLLSRTPQAYHFGAIAADTFFYAVQLPGEPKRPHCCGDLIHGAEGNDTSAPIQAMFRALREAPGDPLFDEKAAFLCGFLSHVALDTILHPYVYHVSGNYYAECPSARREAQVRHRLIESWLDLHLLQRHSLDSARCTFLVDIRRNGAVNRELLRFLFSACEHALGVDARAYNDLLRGYRVQMALNAVFGNTLLRSTVRWADRLLDGRMSTFLALFYPHDEGRIPRDIVDFSSYRHPVTGEELSGGFSTLWEQAVARSGEFLATAEEALFSQGDGAEVGHILPGYNFSTGLVGVPIRDAVYYNCISLERLWCHTAGIRNR